MFKFIIKTIGITLCLSAVSHFQNVYGQGFSYALTGTPVDITGWTIGGDAIVEGGTIRLTDASNNRMGYIHFGLPQDLSGDCSYFNVEFEYKMNNALGLATPADGLAFWFLETPPAGFVLGGGMGMPPVMKGFSFVMDTYNNDAILDNPIITLDTYDFVGYTEGFFGNSVGTPLLNQTYVNDNTWRHCRLEYNVGIMNIYLDHNPTPSISGPIDLEGIIGYFGFSAATGGMNQEHHIREVYITGSDIPVPPVIVDTTTVCQFSEDFTFGIVDSIPGATIYWYEDATSTEVLPGAPVVSTEVPGYYSYYVSQSAPACDLQSERAPVVLRIATLPEVNITSVSSIICSGGSLELNAEITSDPETEYFFTWNPIASLSDPTSLNPIASPTISTNYSIIAHAGVAACADTAEYLITVIPSNITLTNVDDTVCAGTVIPLNVSGHPSLTYHWSPSIMGIDNPNVQNTFLVAEHSGPVYITASHPGCVDVSDSFYLTVEPNPVLSLGDDIKLCMTDTAHLYASVSPAEFDHYTYTWSPGIKLTDSTIKNPIFIGYSDETYIVKVETPNGCVDIDTIDVFVNQSEFIVLNFNDSNICQGDSVQIVASGGVSYKWTPEVGLNFSDIPNPIAYLGKSMEYVVEAVNEHGCVDFDTVRLNYVPKPIINLEDSIFIYPGEEVEIDIETNGHYFSWFPPEGLSNTTIANPIASPDVRTRYFVKITTENGCTDTDSIDVVVHLESLFDVPNAFVPGNSNVNNGQFKILKRGDVQLMKFQIFDRWGQKVFETTDINQGWDGRRNDVPQPKGVYVYVIEAQLSSGRIIQLDGNVTLIR